MEDEEVMFEEPMLKVASHTHTHTHSIQRLTPIPNLWLTSHSSSPSSGPIPRGTGTWQSMDYESEQIQPLARHSANKNESLVMGHKLAWVGRVTVE